MEEGKETNFPQWTCQITTQPKKDGAFTVGEVFELSCEGESVNFKEPLKVKPTKEEDAYTLVLLKPIKLSDNELKYFVTSYKPGEYSGVVSIVDAEGKGITTGALNYKVGSVIKADPSKPPQPFGPIQPFKVDWPSWLFFTLFVSIIVLIGWFLIFFKQWSQKKNLEKNIKKFQSPMGSYHQFSKDIRLLKRSVIFSERQEWQRELVEHYLSQLDEIFKYYILREYVIPATSWSSSKIYAAVKKKDRRLFDRYQESLNRALKELDRAKNHLDSVKSRDCEQLTIICRKAVDAMWKSKHRGVA